MGKPQVTSDAVIWSILQKSVGSMEGWQKDADSEDYMQDLRVWKGGDRKGRSYFWKG